MPELGHFFAGLAQGVGDTKLALEKEKRDRTEREQSQRLQVFTNLLAQPGLKPEMKGELFRMALSEASGGDKKIVDGMTNVLGPLLMQQGGGQTGGVRPSLPAQSGEPDATAGKAAMGDGQSAALPSSGIQKLGSSGSGGTGLFYTPEEETQQLANRAGAVAGAEANARMPADIATFREKHKMEADQKAAEGYQLVGFTQLDPKTGKRLPVYLNPITRQTAYGGEVDPFTTLTVMQESEMTTAKFALARKEGVDNILTGQGIDPATAKPEQRKRAEQAYAKTITDAQEADVFAKKAQATADLARATDRTDKELAMEGMQLQRENLEYNRQRDDYERQGKLISDAVEAVEKRKQEASESYGYAMTIKNHLEGRGIPMEETEPEYDEDEKKNGITWDNYRSLIAKADAAIAAARNLAQTSASQFKGAAEAGGLEAKPGVWPYLKDIREPFTFKQAPGGFAPMPQRGGSKSSKTSTGGKQIDVSDDMMRWLGLKP